MPWGKWKGCELRNVPDAYLSFLTGHGSMTDPKWWWLKESLRAELEFRGMKVDFQTSDFIAEGVTLADSFPGQASLFIRVEYGKANIAFRCVGSLMLTASSLHRVVAAAPVPGGLAYFEIRVDEPIARAMPTGAIVRFIEAAKATELADLVNSVPWDVIRPVQPPKPKLGRAISVDDD